MGVILEVPDMGVAAHHYGEAASNKAKQSCLPLSPPSHPPEGEGRPSLAALCSVVEHHIQDDFDAALVAGLDELPARIGVCSSNGCMSA